MGPVPRNCSFMLQKRQIKKKDRTIDYTEGIPTEAAFLGGAQAAADAPRTTLQLIRSRKRSKSLSALPKEDQDDGRTTRPRAGGMMSRLPSPSKAKRAWRRLSSSHMFKPKGGKEASSEDSTMFYMSDGGAVESDDEEEEEVVASVYVASPPPASSSSSHPLAELPSISSTTPASSLFDDPPAPPPHSRRLNNDRSAAKSQRSRTEKGLRVSHSVPTLPTLPKEDEGKQQIIHRAPPPDQQQQQLQGTMSFLSQILPRRTHSLLSVLEFITDEDKHSSSSSSSSTGSSDPSLVNADGDSRTAGQALGRVKSCGKFRVVAEQSLKSAIKRSIQFSHVCVQEYCQQIIYEEGGRLVLTMGWVPHLRKIVSLRTFDRQREKDGRRMRGEYSHLQANEKRVMLLSEHVELIEYTSSDLPIRATRRRRSFDQDSPSSKRDLSSLRHFLAAIDPAFVMYCPILKSLGVRSPKDLIHENVTERALAVKAHMSSSTASRIMNSAAYLAKKEAVSREMSRMGIDEEDEEQDEVVPKRGILRRASE